MECEVGKRHMTKYNTDITDNNFKSIEDGKIYFKNYEF